MIYKGAEAELYLSEWHGRPAIIKKRIPKGYRITEIDEKIRVQRTKKEALLMEAARKAGVCVPIVYDVNIKNKEIIMQYIQGLRIKDIIDNKEEHWQKNICETIGKSIASIHENGIIHGDITTSNMIVMENKLYFIDFGLGSKNNDTESRGVDLHVLMEAFKATHNNTNLFQWTLTAYKKHSTHSNQVIKIIDEITQRGRYMRKVS